MTKKKMLALMLFRFLALSYRKNLGKEYLYYYTTYNNFFKTIWFTKDELKMINKWKGK